MCLLFETIRIENGAASNIVLHERRMNRTREALFGMEDRIELGPVLDPLLTKSPEPYRCRVTYDRSVRSVEIRPYSRRIIRSLKLVGCDEIEYGFKYEDRSALVRALAMRDGRDDVLIVKNGVVTDTSFSNIAFYDGVSWFTPARPLLPGTRREELLLSGAVIEANIAPGDLPHFRRACIINAMIGLGELFVEMDCIS
ncbi:MAG: aminotransferase class IV [Spirochaetes bacterium]|jgi:4-amino-4-deoxychorismate lyase|nr:aminotransferase class IV [Spirochaetota bacterium]